MRFGIETQRYGQRFEITVQFVVTSAQLSFKLKKRSRISARSFFAPLFICALIPSDSNLESLFSVRKIFLPRRIQNTSDLQKIKDGNAICTPKALSFRHTYANNRPCFLTMKFFQKYTFLLSLCILAYRFKSSVIRS